MRRTSSPASRLMTELLRQRHRITGDQEDDFSIRNLTEIANTATASANTLSLLLAASPPCRCWSAASAS